MSRRHGSFREGAALGLVVATAIWLWIAAVDLLVGEPFRTFRVLGGIVPFTMLHYLLNLGYGAAIVSAIHGARREPRLVLAVAFGFFIIEFGFVMLTVLLSQVGLRELAWVRILGGNVLGAAIAFLIVSRRHSLSEGLRQAQAADSEEA